MKTLLKSLRFFGLFILLFLGLVILAYFTPIKEAHSKFYASLSSAFLSEVGKGVQVKFSPLNSKEFPDIDVECGLVSDVLINKAKRKAAKQGLKQVDIQPLPYRFSSWARVLLPLLFLLSLVLASPVSWKRKGISFLIGAVVYLFFSLWFLRNKLLWRIQFEPKARVYDKDSFAHEWIMGFNKYFPGSLDIFFLIVLLIWLLFTFRREDYRQFIQLFK